LEAFLFKKSLDLSPIGAIIYLYTAKEKVSREHPPEQTGHHIVETSDYQQKIALYIAEDDPDDFCGWNIFEDVVRWWPLPASFEPHGSF
jgi:hypothetical protein